LCFKASHAEFEGMILLYSAEATKQLLIHVKQGGRDCFLLLESTLIVISISPFMQREQCIYKTLGQILYPVFQGFNPFLRPCMFIVANQRSFVHTTVVAVLLPCTVRVRDSSASPSILGDSSGCYNAVGGISVAGTQL